MMLKYVTLPVIIGCLLFGQQLARGAEGASSYYFPGSAGSFATAAAAPPGFTFINLTLIYSAHASRAVLQGRVDADLDVFAVYNYAGGLYTAKISEGGHFVVGGFIPFGHVGLDASLVGSANTGSAHASDFGLGDALLVPGQFHWNSGNFHFKVSEQIFAPTGHYDLDQPINVGRHYWGFDTGSALTYLNPKKGTEISVAPGIMFNTTNNATDYKTGHEFHSDFMVNQFLAKNFALGVQAYYYKQVSGDSGTGAKLGAFQGDSFGWGPAIFWAPKQAGGRVNIAAKWLKDVHSTNRMRGGYAAIFVTIKI